MSCVSATASTPFLSEKNVNINGFDLRRLNPKQNLTGMALSPFVTGKHRTVPGKSRLHSRSVLDDAGYAPPVGRHEQGGAAAAFYQAGQHFPAENLPGRGGP